MTLQAFGTALATLGNVYHYEAPNNSAMKYIVWAEDRGNDLIANDKHVEIGYEGTIDLYTKTEYDPVIEQIVSKLNSLPVAFRLNSVQFEEDTRYIHYEWVFSLG